MASVQGVSEDRFAELRKIFQERLNSGHELGASITVNIDGKNVVDIWGGFASADQPWEKDTIVNVWSSGKTILSMAVLILVDRGLLDVDENVAKYWPEFGTNGKENIKVRHLLSHTSGVSGWEQTLAEGDIYNREKVTSLLAEQSPWWEPGTASGYHPMTMGYLLSELVFRVTGKTISQFINDEIAIPLKADFQIGAKEADWPRIASLEVKGLEPMTMPDGVPEFIIKTLKDMPKHPAIAMTPEWRTAEVAAGNGHGNSRALSKIISAIALGGEVDGVRLLKPETIDLIFQQQSRGTDLILGIDLQFGIGFAIRTAHDMANLLLPGGRICFWGGLGGSIIVADLERRMTFSYTMNQMYMKPGNGFLGNANTVEYGKAIYRALGVTVGEEQ
ncbi:hypothetical protein NQ176_g2532 [Zarea fungicola]|uniref:Uncharacterized protein n=1 Tax=Zarea fungicola TaxID=93591 RepID=A0ACC1NQC3_9HYPO|nr:hypothetical protein NQ176_g2532 [Lecanicillium fungicola]